jgi:hypothetical protein
MTRHGPFDADLTLRSALRADAVNPEDAAALRSVRRIPDSIPTPRDTQEEPMSSDDWARRVVASVPRPTPAEEDAAALDYAETALSEAWAILRRIADGVEHPQQVAADYLAANGFAL